MTEPATDPVVEPVVDLSMNPVVDLSMNPVVDLSMNPADYPGLMNAPPPPPDILTMAEILADQALVVAKEQSDSLLLGSIGSQSAQGLKPRFVEWITKGCPAGFALLSLDIKPPERCSDGETRDLPSYIEFCSGKTIAAHVDLLQAKLPDIQLSYANIGGLTTVVVLTA